MDKFHKVCVRVDYAFSFSFLFRMDSFYLYELGSFIKLNQLNRRIMVDRKQSDRIVFQTAKHHKQILRSQIDPNMINRIQIDKNPSLNYRNAYRSLYHDELQKTVQMQEEKRLKRRQLGDEDRFLYKVGMSEEKPPIFDQTNMSSSQLSKFGQRYVDYDQEKNLKYQDHIKKNYDGGQAFYKSHDKHLQRQQSEALITGQTLSNQMKHKQYIRYEQSKKKKQQNQAFKQLKQYQWLEQQDKLQKQKVDQIAFRQDMVKQIGQQQQRKQKKTIFQYQNIARHNPITNPIQYYIDNPYILKQIQNRNIYKSQDFLSNSRY